MYLPALPRHTVPLGPLQPRRRSLDLYGDILARRYRRDPYDLEQRLARRHYSEPPHTSSASDKPKTVDEATVAIVKQIEKNKDGIWRDIRAYRRTLAGSGIELIPFLKDSARLFDRLFFDNALHKHVNLILDDPKEEILPGHGGKTKMASDGSKVLVMLPMPSIKRAYTHRAGTFLEIAWATILHQLIHAYFMVACGVQSDGEDPDGRLKHGEHFGCLMYNISDVFAKNDHPIPLNFGHPLLPRQTQRHAIELTRDRILRTHKKNSTVCPCDVEMIKKEKIDEWYKKKCVKAVDPDIFIFDFEHDTVEEKPFSKCGDEKDWVELVLGKKSYKLDRKATNFSCVKKKFEDDTRKFNMPDWVEIEIFKSFVSFLTRGQWDPDINETQNGTKGPALLLKYSHNAETPVQHDIAMYQLGLNLEIELIRRIAHSRLVSHQFTHESGHDIVIAVYCDPPTPLDEGLRSFARGFFERHSTPTSGQKPIDCSNWKMLKSDVVFQSGYFGSKKTMLETDMRKAEDALKEMGEKLDKEKEESEKKESEKKENEKKENEKKENEKKENEKKESEKKEREKKHTCTTLCTFLTCPILYQKTYSGIPHPWIHHPHQPQALPPYPPHLPTYIPPTYIPQLIPPPPPAPLIYHENPYRSRPHIPCPESLTLLRQRADFSWLARDGAGVEWVLKRGWSEWGREDLWGERERREREREREWRGGVFGEDLWGDDEGGFGWGL